MKKLLVANYKMNGNKSFYQKVNKSLNKLKLEDTVVLCPPFVYIPFLSIKNKNIFVGAQDITNFVNTKSTGQTSPNMLKEFNAKYVIIGHSERRAMGETDFLVADKVSVAHSADLIPIICVGEQTKESGLGILEDQVRVALSKADNKEIVFAYEPIWAIGSGEQPTVEKIDEALSIIRGVSNEVGFEVKVLYGGSVNVASYKEISKSSADGFLMGGVSNKIDDFVKILKGE